MKKVAFANMVDLDKATHNELYQLLWILNI